MAFPTCSTGSPSGPSEYPEGFGGPANPKADQLIRDVRSRGIAVLETSAPECWETGWVRFSVLHPPRDWYPRASDNARSLVLDVAHAGRHLLLTGDLEQLGLIELLAARRPEPPPDVILAPHHGGKSANPASLYRWANPGSIVVSQRAIPPALTTHLPRSNEMASLSEGPGAKERFVCSGSGEASERRVPRRYAGQNARGTMVTPCRVHWPFPFASLPDWGSPGTIRIVVALAGFALGAILWTLLLIVEYGAWILVVPPREAGS